MRRPHRLRLATPAAAPKAAAAAATALLLAACGGGGTQLITGQAPTTGIKSKTPQAGQRLGFPTIATKNTTRVAGADPIADAAGVALAEYPSAGRGTHPEAVVIAPTGDWQAAIAASVLAAPPIRAPILLSTPGSLPSASSDALNQLAPTGSGAIRGSQVIRIGEGVPSPSNLKSTVISGGDPYSLAAAIDTFTGVVHGQNASNVMIVPADNAAFAMPAAGWAAESGEPILFVNRSGVPSATRTALASHGHPHIYVLAPPSVIPDSVAKQLSHYGTVKRISAPDPVTSSVNFATYRDPPCVSQQPCAHVPGSFGWAMRSPGHGYVLINASRPLDSAAAAPLSASGDYGPQLLIDNPSTLPTPVLNFFLNYATPGYTAEGPTAAVYNHGWVIGDQNAISVAVQAEMDHLLEVVPQK